MQSEQTNELAAALAKAQGQMKPVPFDRTNPHYKNKYASLSAFVEAIRKALADNGIAYTQTTQTKDGAFVLVTTLRHSSGQWVSSEWPLVVARPQEMGASLTYARRYCLSAICGVAADDDDDAESVPVNQNAPPLPKRENPHVTRIDDVTDRRPRFDASGKRIDWIDTSMHRVKPLTGEPCKALYKTLRAAMEMCETVAELEDWGVEHAEQVAHLGRSEEFFQLREYQAKLDELRAREQQEAA
jgi:hypothetical protein